VTKDRTAKALAQFVRSLVSFQSKYDEGLAQVKTNDEPFPNFTREENRGKDLFVRALCELTYDRRPGGDFHHESASLNNGLDADAKVPDLGVADVTFNRSRRASSSRPRCGTSSTHRPYMHDGRLKTHGRCGRTLQRWREEPPDRDPRSGPVGGFRFSTGEKAALRRRFSKRSAIRSSSATRRSPTRSKLSKASFTHKEPRHAYRAQILRLRRWTLGSGDRRGSGRPAVRSAGRRAQEDFKDKGGKDKGGSERLLDDLTVSGMQKGKPATSSRLTTRR